VTPRAGRPEWNDRVDFISPGIVARGEIGGGTRSFMRRSAAPRPTSAERSKASKYLARNGDAGQDGLSRVVARFSNSSAGLMMRRWALSWKANGRSRMALFQRQAISCRSKLVYALAHSAAEYIGLLRHGLIPFGAGFFRAREAMLHSRRMSKIRRYGAGAVVGSQAVARRLRASAEETPPIPMLFLQRLTTSSRNYKAPSTRTRIDPPARRAHSSLK
jgi:hypothetical protein